MALISFGTIVTNIRGKVGGSVFSNSPAGPVVRNKSLPKRRTTDVKSAYNNLWQYLMQSWLFIGAGNQAAWEAYALNFTFHNKLGVAVAANPNLVYAATNYYLYLFTGTFADVPGTFLAPPIASVTSWNMSTSGPDYGIDFTPLVADCGIVIYATPPYTRGKRKFMEKRIQQIGTYQMLATYDHIDFTGMYTAKFGEAPYGTSVLIAIRRINPFSLAWGPLQFFEADVI